jgi:uncharacterized protein (DUF885 family)
LKTGAPEVFDDAVVETGGVPLPVLATAIDAFIAKARAI